MISIKKYLDADTPFILDEPQADELLATIIEAYRSALFMVGNQAVVGCPAPARELESGLEELAVRVAPESTPQTVSTIQRQVEELLVRWGASMAEHLKARTDEVKELLIAVARTAEAVGERDQQYATQFNGLTADLQAIANLDDLTQIRASVKRKAAELKISVDRMALDGQQSLAHMRTKVSTYEVKLKAAEDLASKDPLTGLANRRGVERRMEWYAAQKRPYSIILLDLNLFKSINDKHGHAVGDALLHDFASELTKTVRKEDLVGRWGGDEFIVVFGCDAATAKSQVDRIREWVFGNYTIQCAGLQVPLKIHVEASVGLAGWYPGRTAQEVIKEADQAMYMAKKESRNARGIPRATAAAL